MRKKEIDGDRERSINGHEGSKKIKINLRKVSRIRYMRSREQKERQSVILSQMVSCDCKEYFKGREQKRRTMKKGTGKKGLGGHAHKSELPSS